MKILLSMIAFTVLATGTASAADITITLDNPIQTGTPGETLNFTGTITNLDDENVFLDEDDVNIAGLVSPTDYTWIDDILNTPYPLDPLAVSSDIDLFDIELSVPFNEAYGAYEGTYTLTGGIGADGSDNLGQAGFSVTVAPEPGTMGTLGAGLLLVGWMCGLPDRASSPRA